MGRIVVNKHVDNVANVSPEKFAHKGEIIVSNETGSEGLFILNNSGEIVFISNNGGGGGGVVPTSQHILLSTTQYDTLVKNGSVVVDGKEIFYSDSVYYAVYEDDNE